MIGKLAGVGAAAVVSLPAVPLLLTGGAGINDAELTRAAADICVYGAPDAARAAATIRLTETASDYDAIAGDRSGAYLMTTREWVGAATRLGIDTNT